MLSGRSKLGFSFFALVAAVSLQFVPACTTQSEGQRCARTNGNKDCSAGLTCVSATELRNGTDGVDRCCPDSGSSVTACRRGTNAGTGGSSNGGTGSGGSIGGGGGEKAQGGAGSICFYNSDCKTDLVCGPTGKCQAECVENRDCDSDKSCVKGVCK